MEEKIFEGLKYLISYPKGFQEDKKYPLILFLHGAGARSQTTELLRQHPCFSLLRKHQDARRFILLAPLCSGVTWNECMTPLVHLAEAVRELPFVDKTRVHLTGNSMGGYGTWNLSVLRSDWFASAMPVCGGGGGFAGNLTDLPIRAFHGLQDTTVDPVLDLQMVKAVNLAGGHAELILFPDLAHSIWADVYDNESNYDWLLAFTTERDKELVKRLSGSYRR